MNSTPQDIALLVSQNRVKGAAPLCNISVWEPRFDGFTWRPRWIRE